MIGRVVDGKYRVVDAIGEGGMSSIHEAEHLGLDSEKLVQQFKEEAAGLHAKAAAVLEHTGADGVMIGRAAQGRPWLCGEIAHFLETGELLPSPPVSLQLRQRIRLSPVAPP